MPITPSNPFKGRQFPGEVIILCVRWYLRYPLAYEHVAELLAERGVTVDPSCIWRWVQAYAELPDFPLKVAPSRNPLYDALLRLTTCGLEVTNVSNSLRRIGICL